jgi:hypothetical protein
MRRSNIEQFRQRHRTSRIKGESYRQSSEAQYSTHNIVVHLLREPAGTIVIGQFLLVVELQDHGLDDKTVQEPSKLERVLQTCVLQPDVRILNTNMVLETYLVLNGQQPIVE